MKKYICTVKAIITTTKEVTDTIEIEAPDEVQAEEDAETPYLHGTWPKRSGVPGQVEAAERLPNDSA